MINVTTAATAELIAFYNEHAAVPVKKFQDRKTAEARVTKVVQQLEAAKPAIPDELAKIHASVARPKLTPEEKAKLATIKLVETQKEPSPAAIHLEAQSYLKTLSDSTPVMLRIRLVLDKFPGLTRIELKHTAASVGINPLTARNHFDKVRGTK
jgi:hypothetical protein